MKPYNCNCLYEVQVRELKQQKDELLEALNQIANPILYMQKEAEESGCKLDGAMAVQIANNPEYLKSIAKKAIQKLSNENT